MAHASTLPSQRPVTNEPDKPRRSLSQFAASATARTNAGNRKWRCCIAPAATTSPTGSPIASASLYTFSPASRDVSPLGPNPSSRSSFHTVYSARPGSLHDAV